VRESAGKWSAAEVWRTKNAVMRWKFASGVRKKHADGDYAYGLNDGILECVDLKTGKQVWKDDRRAKAGEAFGHGQILLYDDLIVVLTEYGELVLVEATPEAFRELGRIQALTKGPKTWNVPAMAHGRIYVRNEEQMACFDLTGK
jgi:outer membrane protein assembly factor BamB